MVNYEHFFLPLPEFGEGAGGRGFHRFMSSIFVISSPVRDYTMPTMMTPV
jgi:hypothetical protein